MQAGHYRAALIDSGPSDGLIWYTDDNRAATSVNLSDVGLNDGATSSGARKGLSTCDAYGFVVHHSILGKDKSSLCSDFAVAYGVMQGCSS